MFHKCLLSPPQGIGGSSAGAAVTLPDTCCLSTSVSGRHSGHKNVHRFFFFLTTGTVFTFYRPYIYLFIYLFFKMKDVLFFFFFL